MKLFGRRREEPPEETDTPEDEDVVPAPPREGKLDRRIALTVRLSFLVLIVILAADLVVFHTALGGTPVAAVGLAVLLFTVFRPRPSWVLAGVLLFAVGTITLELPRYDTVQAMLFLAAVGGPLLALLSIAPRLDPDAPPRPQLGAGPILKRFGLLGLAVLAMIIVPVFLSPVRAAWSADLGAVLSVFLIAGATLTLFGPGLVDDAKRSTRALAQPLESGRTDVRFGVLPWMKAKGTGKGSGKDPSP